MVSSAFEHHELLRLTLTSRQHVTVELETSSALKCGASTKCETIVSPFRKDVLQLLNSGELKRLRWESSSKSSNTLSLLAPSRSSPSGISVEMELEKESSSTDTVMMILQRLQDDRLLMAPMESISQKRLHRHILNPTNDTYRVNLPMEGTSVTSEAFQAYLPTSNCGLWGLGNADSWSSFMLGSHSNMVHSPRSMWMEVSKHCDKDGDCRIILKQGLRYGRRWRASTKNLALNQMLPTTSKFSSCPWTDKLVVEVTSPKSITASLMTDLIDSHENDRLRTTTHTFPSSLNKPFLRVEGDSSWSDVSYGRLDRTILRPLGMAYVGSLQTTVTNDDVYEARVSLYDVLPSYVRPTAMDFALTSDATRSYQLLDDNGSMLLQHDFVLPPQSSARLIIDYDPILLPFQQFPSDPNRGIEVPPSWAVWNATTTTSPNTVLYSQSLLLLPPIPDMSMPFNIISLTCTLYAFVIGSIINTIVRRSEDSIYYKLYPDEKPKSPGQNIKEKLGRITEKLFGRKAKQEEEAKEQHLFEDDWIPEAALWEDESDVPYLLTKTQRQNIAIGALPVTVADRRWRRLYSLEIDGDSFESFLEKVKGEASTVIVVKTTKGHLFGGYADHEWTQRKDYYGSGQACLFRLSDDGKNATVYKWTGANRLVQHIDGDKGRIIMGAGSTGGLGLCVQDNFCRGSTSCCETFDNKPLCPDDDGVFDIVSLEVYGFIRGGF